MRYNVIIKHKRDGHIEEIKMDAKNVAEVKEEIAYCYGDQVKAKVYKIPTSGKLKKYHVTALSNSLLYDNIDKIVEAYNKKHAEYLAIRTKNVSYIEVMEVK